MRRSDAEGILTLLSNAIDGKPPSTRGRTPHPREQTSRRAWWLSRPRNPGDGRTSRLQAYILSYLAIAESRFFCSGLPLDNGESMALDKGVIKTCLERDYLELIEDEEPFFRLTQAGAAVLGTPIEYS